jgi:hypothetical protein
MKGVEGGTINTRNSNVTVPIVKQKKNGVNRRSQIRNMDMEEGEDRPTRRDKDQRRVLALPWLLFMLMCIPCIMAKTIHRVSNGAFFQAEREKSFSDSEWVIVTKISFNHSVGVLKELDNLLN